MDTSNPNKRSLEPEEQEEGASPKRSKEENASSSSSESSSDSSSSGKIPHSFQFFSRQNINANLFIFGILTSFSPQFQFFGFFPSNQKFVYFQWFDEFFPQGSMSIFPFK